MYQADTPGKRHSLHAVSVSHLIAYTQGRIAEHTQGDMSIKVDYIFCWIY